MTTHYDIAKAFAKGTGPKRGHHVYRDDFDWRSKETSGSIIYSYGSHFPMAIRYDDDKIFLINGDRYSHTTDRHQSEVRAAIANRNEYLDYKTLTIPFTALRRGYNVYTLEWVHFKVIAVGQEKEICECLTCGIDFPDYNTLYLHRINNYAPSHETHYFHQLAPSIFSAIFNEEDGPKYFISAFDETSSHNSDGYFLSQLPAKPRDIAHAYEMLKPKEVKVAEKLGVKVLRQGDIFAIPTIHDTRSLKKNAHYEKGGMEEHYYWGTMYKRLDYPRLLNTSHVVSEMVVKGDKVYARGTLRHRPSEFGRTRPEHRNISLGKKWHRIVRNTALASYSTGGRVD
jgi:hypothetical protein